MELVRARSRGIAQTHYSKFQYLLYMYVDVGIEKCGVTAGDVTTLSLRFLERDCTLTHRIKCNQTL